MSLKDLLFRHVLVSEDMKYLFTIVDRFTRWPEVIPLKDSKTETIAKAFIRQWVSRFGVPGDITSDRGPQFTSTLWAELNRLLGIKAMVTTAYHPQANGMVERLHRQLKASIKARAKGPNWMDELPLVLLDLRTAWREDPKCSPAELVYGTQLHLPGEFVQASSTRTSEPSNEFLKNLQSSMRKMTPSPPSHHGRRTSKVPKNLATTGFVYIRRDDHRGSLERPYKGPYKIIETAEKFYTVDVDGNPALDPFMVSPVSPSS